MYLSLEICAIVFLDLGHWSGKELSFTRMFSGNFRVDRDDAVEKIKYRKVRNDKQIFAEWNATSDGRVQGLRILE